MGKLETLCENYGFVMDNEKVEFKRIFNNNNFKSLHMDMYSLNPYMLFMRSMEKNLMVTIENNRVIIRKKDRYKTHIMDVPIEQIDRCIIKEYNNMQYEIILAIKDVYYKMLIVF